MVNKGKEVKGEKFMAKRIKIDEESAIKIFEGLFDKKEAIIIGGIGTFLISLLILAIQMEKNGKHDCITITVEDGQIVTQEGEFTGIKWGKNYDIINDSNESFEISVHNTNPVTRYVFSEYIIDNINIIESKDGSYIIVFDEDKISEKGYDIFAKEFVSNQVSEGRQRKRG